ncbi:carboxymuconolactone decarboxylase family protein [Streptomyces krungchingensis]
MPPNPVCDPSAPPPARPIQFDELPEDLASRIAADAEPLSYLAAFLDCGTHQPDAPASGTDFTEALKSALPADLIGVAALGVAGGMESNYELTQYQRRARQYGFSADWIAEVSAMGPDPRHTRLDSRQRAVRELAEAVLADGGRGARPAFERVLSLLDPGEAVGVLLLIGQYIAHAYVANALELTDPTGATEPTEHVRQGHGRGGLNH